LHDWFGDSTDIGRAERIEKSTRFIDEFFQQCDLQKSRREGSARLTKSEQARFLGLDDYSVNETEALELDRLRGISSPDLSELSELRNFCKSEINEVRKAESPGREYEVLWRRYARSWGELRSDSERSCSTRLQGGSTSTRVSPNRRERWKHLSR